jgi:nucleoside-diphosphate-sugar epimerase
VKRVLVLGAGFVGERVASLAQRSGYDVVVTTRDDARAQRLRDAGHVTRCGARLDASIARDVDESTHVIATFQPDEETERVVLPAIAHAGAIAVISSTAVYGARVGVIDETTPVEAPPSPRAARQIESEARYRAVNAVILRAPAIYGPQRGQHRRIISGEHIIPGDGNSHISRIHVEDLAALLLASSSFRDRTFVVGDLLPATHNEIARFVCATHHVPMPRYAPLHEVHETLRGDRRVDSRHALSVLGVSLKYPTFREGMA